MVLQLLERGREHPGGGRACLTPWLQAWVDLLLEHWRLMGSTISILFSALRVEHSPKPSPLCAKDLWSCSRACQRQWYVLGVGISIEIDFIVAIVVLILGPSML
jgi:hypothetical protein